MSIPASYRSKCAVCGEWIEEDDLIERYDGDGEWVHEGCGDG